MKTRIRVYIHFRITADPWGGGNNFLRGLRKYLPACGAEVVGNVNDEYEIFLYNSWNEGGGRYIDLRTLRNIRQFGRTSLLMRSLPPQWLQYGRKTIDWPRKSRRIMVHRVVGISRLYGRKDPSADALQFAANEFADHTVFQSRFSLESFRNEGFTSQHFTIIGNGADPDIFYPAEKRAVTQSGPLRLGAAAWSANPKKGHEMLARLSEVSGVAVSFVGRWPEGIDAKNVRLLGVMPQSELAAVLRDQDAFVHAAQNDPCPNVVYEALSCGLPVLYLDSGGTPEIASEYGMALKEPMDDCLQNLREKAPELRERIMGRREQFNIRRACREYASLFRRLSLI